MLLRAIGPPLANVGVAGALKDPVLDLRALGPSLAPLGISNPLPNPTVTLRDLNGTLLNYNNDWDDDNATEIYLTGIAPSNPAESAIVMTLAAGNYTALVAGLDGGTGDGLVEVYNLQ